MQRIYTCNGTGAQQWANNLSSDGTLRALGKCLDVTGAGTANGTKVQLYDCNGTNAPKWTRNGLELVDVGPNRCLDPTGNSSADGTRLQIDLALQQRSQPAVEPALAHPGDTTGAATVTAIAAAMQEVEEVAAGWQGGLRCAAPEDRSTRQG